MLQIIGWLGCVYLIVKALELASSSTHRNKDGFLNGWATAAICIAWLAALIFGFLFLFQGIAYDPPSASLSPY